MNDAFSDYLTLLDDIEQLPLAARESPSLSAEERATVVARVVELVRNRVVPQSDREEAGREALLDDGGSASRGAPATQAAGLAGHDAILAPIDELVDANPKDGARVQELLYRVHTAIACRFGEAELIHASMPDEEPPAIRASPLGPGPSVGKLGTRSPALFVGMPGRRVQTGPSAWFG
jgi:hypothetical protein